MTTTTNSPIETAMVIDTTRRIKFLTIWIERLETLEKEFENFDGSYLTKMERLEEIRAELTMVREEFIALTTK